MHNAFTVVLIDPTGKSEPEAVFTSEDAEICVTWVETWLEDHRGLAVAVYPPGAMLPSCCAALEMAGAA